MTDKNLTIAAWTNMRAMDVDHHWDGPCVRIWIVGVAVLRLAHVHVRAASIGSRPVQGLVDNWNTV